MGHEVSCGVVFCHYLIRHPGEGRDLAGASGRGGEIPAFAGMTIMVCPKSVETRPHPNRGFSSFTSCKKLFGFLNNLLFRLTFSPTTSASSITKWTQLRLFRL